MSIIYEVNLKVAQSILAEYLDWLKGHMADMCQQRGFLSASLFLDITENNTIDNKESSYIVQYKVATLEDLSYYFAHHAKRMRSEATERFADKFTATRRVLQQV